MKSRKLRDIALVASLGFNLAFLVARYRAHQELHLAATEEGVVGLVADRLGLNSEQRHQFRVFRQQSQSQEAVLRDKDAAAAGRLWDVLNSEEPDPAAVRAVIGEMADNVRSLNQKNAALMLKFLNQLAPDQRRRFLQIAREHRLFKHASRWHRSRSNLGNIE